MMDDMTRRILIGAGVGLGTMMFVALLVVIVLTIRQKLLEREDEQLLHDGSRRRRDRINSALTVSTHHSEGAQTVSEHSITHSMAYNRRSFSIPNGSPALPEPGYEYDPTLQPLHQGHNDPFHHRQVNPEGTHGGTSSHARSGSPAVVPFRESRLPSAGVHYSQDGRLRPPVPPPGREDDPAFYFGLRNRPEPGHRLHTAFRSDHRADVLGAPRRPSMSRQDSHNSSSGDREEMYEKNWERQFRKYSTSSDQGLWALDDFRHAPHMRRHPSADSSDDDEVARSHRKQKNKNRKAKKNNTSMDSMEDLKMDNIEHHYQGLAKLPRVHIPRHNINNSGPMPVQDHLYY